MTGEHLRPEPIVELGDADEARVWDNGASHRADDRFRDGRKPCSDKHVVPTDAFPVGHMSSMQLVQHLCDAYLDYPPTFSR